MAKGRNRRILALTKVWQRRAEVLARDNPGRSPGWIADQIAKEDISNGYKSTYIKGNIHLEGYT